MKQLQKMNEVWSCPWAQWIVLINKNGDLIIPFMDLMQFWSHLKVSAYSIIQSRENCDNAKISYSIC